MTTIYKYTNRVNGMVYVGKTDYPLKRRHSGHVSKSLKGLNTFFGKALRKYGIDSFELETLAEVEELGGFVEMLFIGILRANQPLYGYNLTEGGEGSLGFHHSQESKVAISQKMTNREVTDDFRKKIGILKTGNTYCLGLKRSPEDCIAIKTRMKGNKNALGAIRSATTRLKMSKAAKQRELVKRLKRGTRDRIAGHANDALNREDL
jgi:group I intron endonuclease